jgi:hypothetical protein
MVFERHNKAHTARDRHFYESRCAALDRQLNTLVYELYALDDRRDCRCRRKRQQAMSV